VRLVWGIFALSLMAIVAAILVRAASTGDPPTLDVLLSSAAYLAFGAVGTLIVSRQHSNLVGRLALVTGVAGSVAVLCDTIARLAEPVPAQAWAAWLAQWSLPATLVPPLFLILVFPTGRLASARWRVVAVLIGLGGGVVAVGNALTPRMADYPGLANPLGVPLLTGSPLESGMIGWLPLVAGTVAAGVGLLPRIRQARGVEREQLKWMTYAAALHALAWFVLAFDLPGTAGALARYLVAVTWLLVPVSVGIAILRYRLYNIDRLISRTLVYGALTAILAAAYVGAVATLQVALSSITAQNQLAVAASTLLVAALFQPLRAAIQRAVDRRFYRRKYDAARTLESFGARLRSHVDLDTLRAEVLEAARETVQPRGASLWLRQTTR
jgi:hypothetical protein